MALEVKHTQSLQSSWQARQSQRKTATHVVTASNSIQQHPLDGSTPPFRPCRHTLHGAASAWMLACLLLFTLLLCLHCGAGKPGASQALPRWTQDTSMSVCRVSLMRPISSHMHYQYHGACAADITRRNCLATVDSSSGSPA